MGGWWNLADVRVNTQRGVRTETCVPLPFTFIVYVGNENYYTCVEMKCMNLLFSIHPLHHGS